jgi:hypothetical protein
LKNSICAGGDGDKGRINPGSDVVCVSVCARWCVDAMVCGEGRVTREEKLFHTEGGNPEEEAVCGIGVGSVLIVSQMIVDFIAMLVGSGVAVCVSFGKEVSWSLTCALE